MTPFLDDIVNTPEPTDTVVEVANGHIIQATVTGTVHLEVMDVNMYQVFDVYLENVLHVPSLSLRLFSVTQWTASGGHISFGSTLCHISYPTKTLTTQDNILRQPSNPPSPTVMWTAITSILRPLWVMLIRKGSGRGLCSVQYHHYHCCTMPSRNEWDL